MMGVEKEYDEGTIVSWQTETGAKSGTIQKVFKVSFESESSKTYEASVDDPAYVIAATDGLEVIKRHSDVLKTEGV